MHRPGRSREPPFGRGGLPRPFSGDNVRDATRHLPALPPDTTDAACVPRPPVGPAPSGGAPRPLRPFRPPPRPRRGGAPPLHRLRDARARAHEAEGLLPLV